MTRQIFISSMQKELQEFRDAVCDYVTSAYLLKQFFAVFPFERLPAADRAADEAQHLWDALPNLGAAPGVASMFLLLAIGSMSSNTKSEGEIRSGVVKADLVECMVALPGQLFTNTQILACIWFLTKTKQKRARGAVAFRKRNCEVLFIDARKLGYTVDRVLRAFTDEDTEKIVSTFHAWKRDKDAYEDIAGFCKSATLEEIAEHGCVLTPGRYVGAEEVEDDGIPFGEKMETLTTELAGQFAGSAKLEKAIRHNMKALGFELPTGGSQ